MSFTNTLVVIAGPTAVGKTAVAIEVAKHFDTEILSADSRQCYQEMIIGVARPDAEELSQVQHHFIASHSIYQPVDAAGFEKYGLEVLQSIFTRHKLAVAVGGTGLYIKALCKGLDDIPAVPEQTRHSLRLQYEKEGLPWLQEAVRLSDPEYFAKGEIMNPQRMLRALEVVHATGQSILSFQRATPAHRPFNILKIGLTLPREEIHTRINRRVDQMMVGGQLEEARELYPERHLQALQTVGYQELFQYLGTQCTLDSAVEAIKTNTRRYAKRQLTWFRKDFGYQWFGPTEFPEMLAWIKKNLL